MGQKDGVKESSSSPRILRPGLCPFSLVGGTLIEVSFEGRACEERQRRGEQGAEQESRL